MNFDEFKYYRFNTISDIVEHLPFLEELAGKCNHVTEFGVRNACSTAALISGCPPDGKVVSYDIQVTPAVTELKGMVLPCKWEFVQADTANEKLEIEETDLLFIDTLHTFSQVESELRLHGHKAKKWIAFHDTVTQGEFSDDIRGAEGINRAIREYMNKNKEWKKVYEVDFNNGLLVIERINK